jgi:phosphopantetheine adenylyltransferase
MPFTLTAIDSAGAMKSFGPSAVMATLDKVFELEKLGDEIIAIEDDTGRTIDLDELSALVVASED